MLELKYDFSHENTNCKILTCFSVFEYTSRHHLEIEEGEKKYGKKDCTEEGVQHLRQEMRNLWFLIYLIVVQRNGGVRCKITSFCDRIVPPS